MKIYLVQHGEAVAKDVDPDRPLSDQGRKDIEKMAAFLESAGIRAGQILHSGKTRAQQTAEILAEKLLDGDRIKSVPGINPNDPVQAFAEGINDWSADTMVVGHLPFMARLVSWLLAGQDEVALVTYTPGSVAYLEQDDHTNWSLQWMLRPELVQ
ncbi:MAG: phosphohistidine phosphatase SixA [Gammaproteobacteria bacterium]